MYQLSASRHRNLPNRHARRLSWLTRPSGSSYKFTDLKFDELVDHENLLEIWRQMARESGAAPGPDGISFGDLGPREVGDVMRVVSRALLDGIYRVGKPRSVSIPKPSGGSRTLKIFNVVDRVVMKTVEMALSPIWDRHFLPCSYGFRPGRSHHGLIADLIVTMETWNHWVIATDDIRKAFDFVRVEDVMARHHEVIDDVQILDLIGNLLRAGRERSPYIGIAQGSPFSPLCLNVLLHLALDQPVDAGDSLTSRYFRYADNLAYACQDVTEGEDLIDQARQWLAGVGLNLKGTDTPKDLSQNQEAEILGHRLTRAGYKVRVRPTPAAWKSLEGSLRQAWDDPHPDRAAKAVLKGWIEAMGPALENVPDTRPGERILQISRHTGFRGVIQTTELDHTLETAYLRWRAKLERARHRMTGGISP